MIGWRRYVHAAFLLCALRVVWLGWRYSAHVQGVQRHHVESAFFVLLIVGLPLCLRTTSGPLETPWTEGRLPPWIGWLFVLQAASILLFWPALSVGLLSDDFVLLERAEGPRWLSWMAQWHFRPLPLWLFGVVDRAWKDPAGPLHWMNMALHATNAYLVSRLAARLGLHRRSALLAGGLFLAYPAAVEAVVWCSGVQDVLMTTAALAFVLAVGAEWPFGARAAVCAASLAVGFLTKETAVVFPCLAVAAFAGRGGADSRKRLGLMVGGGVLAAGYVALLFGLGAVPPSYVAPVSRYALKELLVRLFATLAAPWSQQALDLVPALTAASVTLFTLLVVACLPVWTLRSAPLGLAARMVSWILLSIAPTAPFFYVGSELQGSRYTYLAEVGFAILFVEGIEQARVRVGASAEGAALAGLLVLVVSAWAVRIHLHAWVDAGHLRDDVVEQASREAGNCASVAFAGVPDHIRGAYVFRNGLPEALRRWAPHVGSGISSGEAACRVTLKSPRFETYAIVGSP